MKQKQMEAKNLQEAVFFSMDVGWTKKNHFLFVKILESSHWNNSLKKVDVASSRVASSWCMQLRSKLQAQKQKARNYLVMRGAIW